LEHQFNDNIGLEITNSFGQVVLNSTITSPNQSLNLQHLSQGLYHLKLYN